MTLGAELLGPSPLSKVWLIPAGVATSLACLLSFINILLHLKNYRRPHAQRLTVRIIFMIPVFAFSSWVSLALPQAALILGALREIYEAFVIYCFFNLLITYLGGEREMLISMHKRPPVPYVFPVSMWQRYMDPGDPYTFLKLKRGVLHFIYIKPLCAISTMLITWVGDHYDGFNVDQGHAILAIIYNISYSACLWCLSMFFIATKEDLRPFRAVPKFLCIKAVIFFSFWQGVVISIFVKLGIIHNTEIFLADHIATAAQDFLLCLEVFPAAIGHLTAFPASDYRPRPGKPSGRLPIFRAARDSMGIMDVWRDTVDTFTGEGFDYRTFEPAEGVAGTARRRIASGLRYVEGGKKKYWLESLRRTSANGPSIPRASLDGEGGRPSIALRFALDPNLEDVYAEARCLIYGDYNCPIVDEMPKGMNHPSNLDESTATGEPPGSKGKRKGKGKARSKRSSGNPRARASSPPVDVYDEESALLHPPW
ncbi:organic solute transporter Ostalpha-domain-containing protein [Piptocephalis cylindrospora]|uniref:Organic solute transporter Ostalpha-domain-containing protein n=1 Tax=Piptocephalis cylindrospora TaxID=1907219 RepID=A0A4P9Y2T6_9FUNG|nr:organic solute transporter Ostalpha-domain-containing protein [Piptocephalis cylindrospora]|eukprot:RKP12974.1 organic solute transporter Ostalpha-domain-containing protein [Piptocephalis cylindrospora]